MFLQEYGYYKIRAFEHCHYYYLNYVRNAPKRRPESSLIQSVVGDIAHEVVEARVPVTTDRSVQQIERRLPVQYHKEAKKRAKRSLRGARQVIAQHPGKPVRKTFRWRDEGEGHLGCLLYTTPDRTMVADDLYTIIETKSGRGEDLRDHLRFHGIIAASEFQASGIKPRIHLVGYLLDRELTTNGRQLDETADSSADRDVDLVQITSGSADPDYSKLVPAVDFWYRWDYLESEQDEVRGRVQPIMKAEAAGEFSPEPNDDCPWCDYLLTGDCIEGQEHVMVLQAAKERRRGLAHLGDVFHKSPASETCGNDGKRKQA
jgi:PD-(D/E)XK nuclease superfamily